MRKAHRLAQSKDLLFACNATAASSPFPTPCSRIIRPLELIS